MASQLWLFFFVGSFVPICQSSSWVTCPFAKSTIDGYHIQCRNFTLPLFYNSVTVTPNGVIRPLATNNTINWHVTRLVKDPNATSGKPQAWLLNGGPGGSGVALLNQWMQGYGQIAKGFDAYLPDHRGTGYSDRLVCPPGPHSVCIKKFKTVLPYFTTTNAAHDVDYGMRQILKEEGQPSNFVYGVSYGSYWLNRFLFVAKFKPTAISMDGVCDAQHCRFQLYSTGQDNAGRHLMAKCDATPDCVQHFGGYTSTSTLERIVALMRTGSNPCPGTGINDLPMLRSLLVNPLFGFFDQPVLPAAILRLIRCNAQDKEEIKHALQFTTNPPPSPPPPFPSLSGNFVGDNILFSEMFAPNWKELKGGPIPMAELKALNDSLWFSNTNEIEILEIWEHFPKYPKDKYWNKIAPRNGIPLIVTNGAADEATMMAWAVQEAQVTNSTRDMHLFPNSPHPAALNTPTVGRSSCASQMINSFFHSHGEATNTGCKKNLLDLDWAGALPETKNLVSLLFGKGATLWGSP